MHRDADRDGLRFGELLEVVADVELRQHEHRIGARVPGGDEVALDAPRVEVTVEAGDEQHGVDVRHQDVLLGFEPRGLAGHLRVARENRLDGGAATRCVADGDPVPDRGHRAPELAVPQPPAGIREPLVPLAAHEIPAAMLRDDPSGLEAALGIWWKGRLELVGPAESGQGSIGQREAPSLGWVNQAAARGVREKWC